MSSAGQIVGGLIGGVVGTFTPAGTFLGAQLGMMLGGYIDPGEGVVEEGPRLSDLTVQTSTYGAVIPDLHGTDAVSGNVFWLQGNKIDETPVKKKTGGKGGQKKTTVTWVNTATFAIGLCRGPVVGVRRIWLGGELYYDAGSSDPGTIAASNAAAEGFKVYLGTDTQDADPRIQADLGVANTPAWRGRAYIVFYDLDLAKYSGSLIGVQAKVELFQVGEKTIDIEASTTPYFGGQYQLAPAFADWGGIAITKWPGNTDLHLRTDDGLTWESSTFPNAGSWVCVGGSDHYVCAIGWHPTLSKLQAMVSSDGAAWAVSLLEYRGWEKIATNGAVWCVAAAGWVCTAPMNGSVWTTSLSVPTMSAGVSCIFAHGARLFLARYDQPSYVTSDDNGVTWTTRTFPWGAGWGLQSAASDGATIVGLSKSGMYAKSTDGGVTWGALSLLVSGYTGWTDMLFGGEYFLASRGGNIATSDDAGDTWVATYIPAATGVGYTGDNTRWTGSGFSCVPTNYGTVCWLASVTVVAAAANLGDIVSAECLQSGLLTSGDIDVSQLTDLVRGYTDSSSGAIRDSLSPLQMAWPFDVRQRGYKLEFVRRGGASIRTIDANDLDARGSTTSPGVKITQAREMNLQLPRSVTVNHKDYDREYAVGEQYAERLSTDAVNEVAYELPIVMTASEAAQKADILLYLAWMERVDLSFSLPNTYLNLEPGDVISLPVNGSLASVRVVSLTYTSDGRIEVTGKFAAASTYVSSAVGVSPLVTAQTTLNLPGASSYALMDVPTMHATQLDPSFLVSMYGATGWPGGVLLRSDDSGTTWADLQAFSSPGGTAGSATSVIGVVDSRVWDNASVLSVGMTNGELFSVTAEAVLNGSNYFAYGADGRWEIIGVKTCALVSANTYNLSTILRGRFGTEWAMSTHLSGDKVVLLSDTDVTAIGVSISVIGLMRTYRGVTLDQDVSTATDTFFTYAGVNLKPLSAAYCTLYRDVTSDDIVGSWVRRTRYGGEWADSIDVPLYETSESYQVDIFTDGSYSTVVRTLSASSQSVVYSAAEQTSDFGSYPATVYYKLYQLSSDVGRGYPFIGQANF